MADGVRALNMVKKRHERLDADGVENKSDELVELECEKWFGEHFGHVGISVDLVDAEGTVLHVVAEEEMPEVDVLCLGVADGVFGERDGTGRVAEDWCRFIELEDGV